MRRLILLVCVMCCCLLWASVPGRAEAEASPRVYALVVASHAPGQGQASLQFAGRDAERMEAVLRDLGGLDEARTARLVDPDAKGLDAALAQMESALADAARRGEPSILYFYYSGHAKALSLNLGAEEYPMDTLRARLEAMPSTVTLVMLDACQSGSVGAVKGVEPAADFSYNAANQLSHQGMVIIASSTERELSQESSEIEGSFFTHHLVSGLRGAADTNRDQVVTLGEAYQYAYHRTLLTTAQTAVGVQHATLETSLQGAGEIALTRLGQAYQRLRLPGMLAGEVIVHRKDDARVFAEVHKVAGEQFDLALPPGDYSVVLRDGVTISSCATALSTSDPMTLRLSECSMVEANAYAAKGADADTLERWGIRVGMAAHARTDDPYIARLEDFNFEPNDSFQDIFLEASYMFSPYFGVTLDLEHLESREYIRTGLAGGSLREERFRWSTWAATVSGRAQAPLADGWLIPYIDLGVGVGMTPSEFLGADPALSGDRELTDWGVVLAGRIGLTTRIYGPVGLSIEAGYTYAPILTNLIGDTLNSGGIQLGFATAFMF